jgi:hypothetical protein
MVTSALENTRLINDRNIIAAQAAQAQLERDRRMNLVRDQIRADIQARADNAANRPRPGLPEPELGRRPGEDVGGRKSRNRKYRQSRRNKQSRRNRKYRR